MTPRKQWSATIRVRRARYKWLCQQFEGKPGYHDLPDQYGTRTLRLYNVSRGTVASVLLGLKELGEPFDCTYKGGLYGYGRIQQNSQYTLVPFIDCTELPPPESWVNQNLFYKRAQTRKLLKPEE